jgi:molecular chaperone DnaK (HSP70)
MPGRLAVDFGTSNTVVAGWDDRFSAGVPLHLPEFGQRYRQGQEEISFIPSLIHYAEDGRRWLGQQVLERDLYRSPRTFRWMKRYITHRSPFKLRLEGRQLSPFDAGRDFLSAILLYAAEEIRLGDEEVAFTVPVEAFEHYEDWLAGVAERAGMPRFRLIDEPSAAALGYGAHIQPGDVYLIFDFGGGTLDVSAVLIEAEAQAKTGRRCRVLGKAGAELGGTSFDQWLLAEVLARNGCSDADEVVRRVSNSLLVACEQAKEQLSFDDRAEISVTDPVTGAMLAAEITRGRFEEILDEREAYTQVDRTIRRALNAARERGYREEDVKAVLMVGGSSQVPAIQQLLRRIFGRERVMLDRPLDAVARGAAAFVAGVDFYDHIQHDYAVRYVNRQRGEYDYQLIVRRGTPYPAEGVSRLTVKAALEGQTQLGLAIFELGETLQPNGGQPFELVFDPTGAARIIQVEPDEAERRTRFWMNEENPTFLAADPPARQGEARFEVEFSIDGNKRLLITARDLLTGRIMQQHYPVVKLT